MEVRNLTPWLSHRVRPATTPVTTVVLHATAGGSLSGAIETLRGNGFSYHYIIDTSGVIHKCVPLSGIAFHAGSSYGPREEARNVSRRQLVPSMRFEQAVSVNPYSFGISFVNRNNATDPYEAPQLVACKELLESLCESFPSLRFLTTHAWVSPRRKSDPRRLPLAQLTAHVPLAIWKPAFIDPASPPILFHGSDPG